jgi:hypothetical protein
LDVADIVATEQALDPVEVGQRSATATRPVRCRGVYVTGADRVGRLDGAALNGRFWHRQL